MGCAAPRMNCHGNCVSGWQFCVNADSYAFINVPSDCGITDGGEPGRVK